ncbi:MAG: nucleoside-diphosphate kinase [Deltaproteobacteria bacterium]|nr:nucleoside-diphosphate kinase [Deltaproteobacteria bacterium]MBI3293143.1 nucleoside-diphosphate kinase [Deltaproteobacteria bacterium]
MERTFSIIKPNAVKRNLIGKIIAIVEENGLKVVEARMKSLTQQEAEGFYAEHKERPFFPSLVKFMTSGPILLLALEGEGAVEKYRKVMGATDPAKAAPGTLRALFGEGIEANACHGSDSPTSAQRELAYFFGS